MTPTDPKAAEPERPKWWEFLIAWAFASGWWEVPVALLVAFALLGWWLCSLWAGR